MITSQILVKNNENTITETLKSIRSLGPIIIGDMGCSDKTIQICRKFNVQIIKTKTFKNFSTIRAKLTEMSDTTWNLCIQPWEIWVGELEILSGSSRKIQIFSDDLITKEIRIWNKNEDLKFQNPGILISEI